MRFVSTFGCSSRSIFADANKAISFESLIRVEGVGLVPAGRDDLLIQARLFRPIAVITRSAVVCGAPAAADASSLRFKQFRCVLPWIAAAADLSNTVALPDLPLAIARFGGARLPASRGTDR